MQLAITAAQRTNEFVNEDSSPIFLSLSLYLSLSLSVCGANISAAYDSPEWEIVLIIRKFVKYTENSDIGYTYNLPYEIHAFN